MSILANTTPDLSVIIPTRNRARSLLRTLEALARQRYPADRFEVIVVANECSDDTCDVVRRFPAPFALHLNEQHAAGISRARNSGATMARGRVLVFLDDDLEPLPTALHAHAIAHAAGDALVAIGPLLSPAGAAPDLLAERLHRLDSATAAFLGARKAALPWYCVIGGNMSTTTAVFHAAGGFDAAIVSYGGEDYEFACRAQQAGARFSCLVEAAAHHHSHEHHSLAGYLRRGRSVGSNDVDIVRRHPEVLDHVPLGRLAHPRGALGRLGRAAAFDSPRLGDAVANLLTGVCACLAVLRMPDPWNRLVDSLYQYWYYRGVADRLGSRAAAAALVDLVRRRLDGGLVERRLAAV